MRRVSTGAPRTRSWSLVCLAAAALVSCGPVPEQADPLATETAAIAESDIFDWPMGGIQNGEWVPGYDVRVMQTYANRGDPLTWYDGRAHSAADLARDSTTNAGGSPVYAAANGTIRCVINSPNPADPNVGYPGAVIVVEHQLTTGTMYSMYGHLNNSTLTAGTTVTRGQQIGTVWTWIPNADNSHLHYEVRTWLNWQGGGCSGPGYALNPYEPDQQGWRDPIDWHYAHRPSFPGTTVSTIQMNVRSSPSISSSIIGSVAAGTRVYAESITAAAAGGPEDWWYRVKYDGVNYGYAAGYNDQGWGGDLMMVELRRTDAPPPTCPYSSLQTRVQPNASTPWSQTLTINQGQSFSVATFYNGSGQLTGCCTTITVTGPNGYSVSPSNLGSVTPPAAGTYTVRGTCGGVTETATVTVNAPASCPYSSIQTRVQPNSSTPWSQTLTVTAGQSFTVGSFYNGSGQLTGCCTSFSVTGPNGFTASPANLGTVTTSAAGTYSVTATCGSISETATVTATSGTVSIALNNPGMETQSSAQYGFLTSWGPSGAWAFHSGFPRNGNAGLGTRFGYYSAGTSETVGQLLTTRFQANRLYTFRGYAQGGGDNTGVVPFQLGYAATDGVLSSFTPLATATYAVGADWVLRAGVSYRTPASGGPVGKQIIVRLGSGANGGQGDIWFDQFQLFHAP